MPFQQGRAWAGVAGVAPGIAAGCAVCAAFGGLQAPAATACECLAAPRLLAHGFTFSWHLVLPFAFIGLPTQPALVAQIPELVRPVFASGISAGGLTANLLNAVWRK